MIRVVKDNAVLSIKEEDLTQYEARGYNKVGAIKKVALKDLEKEIAKLTKINEKLTVDNEELTKINEKLTVDNEELTKANEKLTKDIEELKRNVK